MRCTECVDIPSLHLLSCVVSGRKRWQCIVGSNDAPTRDSSPCDGCGAAAAACYGAWCLVMLARLRVVCDAGCRVGHCCARERKRAASVGLYSRKCDVYLRLLCCAYGAIASEVSAQTLPPTHSSILHWQVIAFRVRLIVWNGYADTALYVCLCTRNDGMRGVVTMVPLLFFGCADTCGMAMRDLQP